MAAFHRTRTPGVYYKETSSGRSYYIDFVDDAGKRRREKVDGDYESAKVALGHVDGQHASGTPIPGKITISFNEYASAWIDAREKNGKLKPNSASLYRERLRLHIAPVIGRKKLNKITRHDTLRVIEVAQEKGLAGWTINNIVAIMSGAFKAATWEYGITNPVQALLAEHRPKKKSKRRTQILNGDEIEKLLAEAGTDEQWVLPLLALAIYSGLRQSELLGLWWEDLDLTADIPTVRCHAQLGKDGGERLPYLKAKDAGAERVVELPRHVARLLAKWKLASPFSGPVDYVFAGEDGRPICQSWARRKFKKLRDAVGIQADQPEDERCHFHDMRDTFASMLIAGGANIVEVQHALGHEKASTTLDMYAHLWNAQERRGRLRDILEGAV